MGARSAQLTRRRPRKLTSMRSSPRAPAPPLRPGLAAVRMTRVVLGLMYAYALNLAPFAGAALIIAGVLTARPSLRYWGLLILAAGCAHLIYCFLQGFARCESIPFGAFRNRHAYSPRRRLAIVSLTALLVFLLLILLAAAVALIRPLL
jgi:hypothetical protein